MPQPQQCEHIEQQLEICQKKYNDAFWRDSVEQREIARVCDGLLSKLLKCMSNSHS